MMIAKEHVRGLWEACRCCCCLLFTLYVSLPFYLCFTTSFFTRLGISRRSMCIGLSCRHGFVMRSPGSWLGGSCENTRAAWQLFFTARTWAKPHRFDSSVTLLLRRVVQSKTQWHSNVLKLLKLLQKSSQASRTFFQLLQIKRLQLKLTSNLPNSYQISSQHQVPKTWVKQHPKTPKTQKQTKIHLQALPCTNWFHLVPNWFLPGSYRFLWVL